MSGKLQRPLAAPPKLDDNVRVTFADEEDSRTEAAVDAWLRSLLDSPGTPEEGRRS